MATAIAGNSSYFITSYNVSPVYAVNPVPVYITAGMVTGIKTEVLGSNVASTFAIINIFIIIFFAFWLYSVVKLLLTKKRMLLVFNEKRFVSILIVSLAYSIFLSIYFVISYNSLDVSWGLIIIIPGNFFLGYAYFYLLNFSSRVISSVEVGKVVKFDQYANYFFCLIFFPIGIWWINPKIRSVLEKITAADIDIQER